MESKLFTDLIDALGKVATGLKTTGTPPGTERDRYRQTLDETFRLIDTTLNMVIIRLGDILLPKPDAAFVQEAAQLDNYGQWMQAEREFRLCRSLRASLHDTETLASTLSGTPGANDWDTLLQQMRSILASEGEVAEFIGRQFYLIAGATRGAGTDASKINEVRDQLAAFRGILIAERKQLIQQELTLFEVL